jgi:hypothetical protein
MSSFLFCELRRMQSQAFSPSPIVSEIRRVDLCPSVAKKFLEIRV